MKLRKAIRNPYSIVRLASVFVALVIGVLGTAEAQAAAPNLLINATSNTNNNLNGTIGYKFAAALSAPTIKGLGFVDAGEDGLAASHQVGLYYKSGTSSSYVLERSVTIGAGTAYHLNGGYRWYPIADYTLSDVAADAYFIAATVTSGDGDFWGGQGSADMTSVGNNALNAGYNTTAGSSSSSVLPATWNGSFPGNTFYNAPNATMNVVPVPEPSTYIMALAGLACGGYSLFRRRKRA